MLAIAVGLGACRIHDLSVTERRSLGWNAFRVCINTINTHLTDGRSTSRQRWLDGFARAASLIWPACSVQLWAGGQKRSRR